MDWLSDEPCRLCTKQDHSFLRLEQIVATVRRCVIEKPVALEEGKVLGQLVASTEDPCTGSSGAEEGIDHVAELVQTDDGWRRCLPGCAVATVRRCVIEKPVALEEGKVLGQLVASTEDPCTGPSGAEEGIDHVAELVQTDDGWRRCLPGCSGPDGSWEDTIRGRDVMMIDPDTFPQ